MEWIITGVIALIITIIASKFIYSYGFIEGLLTFTMSYILIVLLSMAFVSIVNKVEISNSEEHVIYEGEVTVIDYQRDSHTTTIPINSGEVTINQTTRNYNSYAKFTDNENTFSTKDYFTDEKALYKLALSREDVVTIKIIEYIHPKKGLILTEMVIEEIK